MKLGRKFALIVTCILLINNSVSANRCFSCLKYSTFIMVPIISVGVVLYKKLLGPYIPAGDLSNINLSMAKEIYCLPEVNAKKYDEIPSIASHNSHAFPYESWDDLQPRLLQNQSLDFNKQLEFGARTFLIDINTSNFWKNKISSWGILK